MKTPLQHTFICSNPLQTGLRLDKFLQVQMPESSRSYLQHLITEGLVLVNNAQTKANYSVKHNDCITVTCKTKEYNLDPIPVQFQIIDYQDDFIVINKPAGLIVHHAPSTGNSVSLVNGLLHTFLNAQEFENKERPGIVHRLDKNTSGLMIIAANQTSHHTLCAMFKDRKVQKTYLAIVYGHPPQQGVIDYPIGRHPVHRHRMATFGIDTRPALTHYKVLAYYTDCSLVEARIITGRTHQIRVHFEAIGHGLLGDEIYGHSTPPIGRQALHAWKISFTYKNNAYHYVSPLPEDLVKLVTNLQREKKQKPL